LKEKSKISELQALNTSISGDLITPVSETLPVSTLNLDLTLNSNMGTITILNTAIP
jgi:hypothetical protein